MNPGKTSILRTNLPTPGRLFGFLWSAGIVARAGGFPEIGLYFNGGLGDELMCSAVARELKKRGAGKIWIFTAAVDVFAGNPDVVAVPADHRLHRFCDLFRVSRLELEYPRSPPRHLIAMMCALAGIKGEIDLRPYAFVTEPEKRAGKRTRRPQIAMQTSSLGARYPMRNKQWPHGRFQIVADALKDKFDVVQLGAPGDPEILGSLDLRGKTSPREAAAILAASHLFVGLEGGLMHLARAVECRSVIVYGGYLHPDQSGYSANENLYWDGACSPCWKRNDCDFDRICMTEIEPDAVIAAAFRQIDRHGQALAVDQAQI